MTGRIGRWRRLLKISCISRRTRRQYGDNDVPTVTVGALLREKEMQKVTTRWHTTNQTDGMGLSSYWQKLHGKRGRFAPISTETMTYCSSINSCSIVTVEPWIEFRAQGLSNDMFIFIVRRLENSRWYMANKTDRIFAILYWFSLASVSTVSNIIGQMRVKSNWSDV